MPHPLTIFVYEYLTSGTCAEVALESSLMTEGRAMAEAVVADFAALEDVRVVTLRDKRLSSLNHRHVTAHAVSDPNDEAERFQELCGSSDRILIIAPETDGLLAQRIELARRANPTGVLNCSGKALLTGCDKWELAQRLTEWDIPAIPTALWKVADAAFGFPVVIKPRDGAGCEGIRILRELIPFPDPATIVQPLRNGVALSSAACFSPAGERILTLPLGEQLIEIDQSIHYRGGELPWQSEIRTQAERQAEWIWQKLEQNLSGLAGYVGIDWLWDEQRKTLLLVEINPRLTTAYVGYRELCNTQIVEAILGQKPTERATSREVVRFSSDGSVERIATAGVRP